MAPYLETAYGNPSSSHWAGQAARTPLERARAEVADLIGASPNEIVFTSGGTEANNHAIKGSYLARRDDVSTPHIITTAIEHPAVLEPCRFLERLGARITRLPVDKTGLVDPERVKAAITNDTILITVMHANNEVGTIEPIAEIGAVARARGVPLHTDAAQSIGKVTARVDELGVDLMSVAGHKLYAPKGVGALYIRNGRPLEPLIHGAGHERGRRAGTENVLLAVGLGAACRLALEHPCTAHLDARSPRISGRSCATGWATVSSSSAIRNAGCRIHWLSPFAAGSAKRCSPGSAALQPQLARRVTAARSRCRRCCDRWAAIQRSVSARCDSAWADRPQKQSSTWWLSSWNRHSSRPGKRRTRPRDEPTRQAQARAARPTQGRRAHTASATRRRPADPRPRCVGSTR